VTRVKTTVKEKQGVRFHFENVREMDLAKRPFEKPAPLR